MPDMEEIIKNEVNQISGLKERVAFKDIVEQVFLSLYETNQEMYRVLEERVMEELAFDINRYRICTGVVERELVDRSHHLLLPMRESDLFRQEYDALKLTQTLREEGQCHIKTLFLECDYIQLEKLLNKKKTTGKIITERGEYPAEFSLRRNTDYLEEIAHLYEVFTGNGVRWQTVNAPYLYKFVDICLTGEFPDFPADEHITDIQPDLEEFSDWAREGYVPLWNVRKLKLASVGFPVPCEDHKNFEHIISIREYGNEHIYLIDDDRHIYNVRQLENRLVVMGEEAEASKWDVYMIISGENRKFERFTYPVMTNQRKKGFMECFFRRQGMSIRTGAELIRFIREFDVEEYLEYEGYELTDRQEGPEETYSMNGFILDEIRDNEYRKCLLLKFRGKEKHSFLLRDIMSYVVSEVQMMYPEYMCVGTLK